MPSGSPFVQGSRTNSAILVDGIIRQFFEVILNLSQWFRCCLKDFLSGALAALLSGGAKPFMQF